MRAEQRNDDALEVWESEGGRRLEPVRPEKLRQYGLSFPHLPYGCDAQTAWGFRDETGRFHCEFHRVYSTAGMGVRHDDAVRSRLREDLSYWMATWPVFVGTEHERPASRWISYSEARKVQGPRLTFAQFSSSLQMRGGELEALLHLDDIAPLRNELQTLRE